MKNVCLSLIALMCFGCSSTQKSPFISVNDVTDETPADQLVRDEDGLGAGDAFGWLTFQDMEKKKLLDYFK